MKTLDPGWLAIELEAIQKQLERWTPSLNTSYDAAVQRVHQYQAETSTDVRAGNEEAPFLTEHFG